MSKNKKEPCFGKIKVTRERSFERGELKLLEVGFQMRKKENTTWQELKIIKKEEGTTVGADAVK